MIYLHLIMKTKFSTLFLMIYKLEVTLKKYFAKMTLLLLSELTKLLNIKYWKMLLKL